MIILLFEKEFFKASYDPFGASKHIDINQYIKVKDTKEDIVSLSNLIEGLNLKLSSKESKQSGKKGRTKSGTAKEERN